MTTDPVEHPEHYEGVVTCPRCTEPIDAIIIIEQVVAHWGGPRAFRVGQALAYLIRHVKKNGDEDLRKAIWYLRRQLGEGSGYQADDPFVEEN